MLIDKRIRLAAEDDNVSILEIYSPYIKDTIITFENDIPTIDEFTKRMSDIQKKYPWLVCEYNGSIIGYAYASQFNSREAYDWSVDFSIYIKPQYYRKGIGKALYYALVELLKLQGYYNAYAGITLPNINSESLHKSIGFKSVGIYKNVGYKLENWHDVEWLHLKLQDYSKSPNIPKTIDEISNTTEFNSIIHKAELLMNDISGEI